MEIAALLQKYSIQPDPDRSQHFMVNEKAIKEIVSLADIRKSETVLEIGPGLGVLTRELAKKAGKVVAVEVDEKLAGIAKRELLGLNNVEIIQGDVLHAMENMEFDRVVSNTPYMILEPLVQKLARKDFRIAVLTLPAHFVHIITARLGDEQYSKLSAFVGAFFRAEVKMELRKEDFRPVPNVNNVVVKLGKKSQDDYEAGPADYILKEIFSQRARKVKNALMEALISYNTVMLGVPGTKNKARAIMAGLKLRQDLLEKTPDQININDIKLIISRTGSSAHALKMA
ncbi:MAG: ribosomal RNA small subunit methyltransferase A [Candidatus Aenigmarchaeota archaeon]|nr:ribosomal RNA small subunit methyltransferase A [Candidatus Aenigmarchaeota archaeon]